MSEYIHEIVLQEYIIENISSLNLTIEFGARKYCNITAVKINTDKTFWDLEGKLDNGIWIPIEVEWISHNFLEHKHHKSKDYKKFLEKKGVLITLRKNKEIDKVQQISILDNISEKQFKKNFKTWFKGKSGDYVDKTINNYITGNYNRKIPRILLYPLSKDANKNYFPSGDDIYKKESNSPSLLGFKEKGYINNVFIRDLQPNDICVFIYNTGSKMERALFKQNISEKNIVIHRLVCYKVKSIIINRQENKTFVDDYYWPDEINEQVTRYPYVCEIEDKPFILKKNFILPYYDLFSDTTWEDFRSCMLHKEYREISPLDFSIFISGLK